MRNTLPNASSNPTPPTPSSLGTSVVQRVIGLFRKSVPTPASEAKSDTPQFPGLEFRATEIGFEGESSENDAAVYASLVCFKHKWPGRCAIVDGSEAFREKVRKIAAEVGGAAEGANTGIHRRIKYGQR